MGFRHIINLAETRSADMDGGFVTVEAGSRGVTWICGWPRGTSGSGRVVLSSVLTDTDTVPWSLPEVGPPSRVLCLCCWWKEEKCLPYCLYPTRRTGHWIHTRCNCRWPGHNCCRCSRLSPGHLPHNHPGMRYNSPWASSKATVFSNTLLIWSEKIIWNKIKFRLDNTTIYN